MYPSTILILGGSSLLATNWALHLRHFSNIILVCHHRLVSLPNVRIVLASEFTVSVSAP